ncbi:VgrG protein [hydrothermal vent metagenome]|uniref:VgrG protein n=1 Tax=hydrothermal vent metagenome TaxID=652676 RepID=A0A1W1BV22_9ZZZZ
MKKKLQKVNARFYLLTAQAPNTSVGVVDDSYSIQSISGHSSINDAYLYTVKFVSDDVLPIEKLADTDAYIKLQDENTPLRKRDIHGKIYKIEESGSVAKKYLYTATVVSPFYYLGLNNKLDSQNFPVRETCTQYNQSDAEFIMMLAEEEKFSINFNSSRLKSSTLESYTMILSNMNEHASILDEVLMGSYNRSKKFTPTSQTENFYDFESPSHNYLTEHGASVKDANLEDNITTSELRSEIKVQTIRDRLELLDDARAKDLNRYTKLNAIASYSPSELISGQSESLYTDDSLYVELNEKQTGKTISAVITSTSLTASFPNALDEHVDTQDKYSFNVSFTAIAANTPFIAAQAIVKPLISGIHTAIVSGGSADTPEGENTIDVDELGRIKVIFHFDNDKPTSAYVRLGTMFSGNNWGSQFLPRVNTEVIVSFINGDIDKPVIVGAVYNGNNKIPKDLPDSKTQSYIKTQSMPQHEDEEGYNELLFEDKNSEELLSLRAQKDYKLHAQHDSAINIDNDQVEEVGNDETITIGNDRTTDIGNNDSLTVSGNQTETVMMNKSESILIAKALSVGAGYQTSVGGAKNETVGLSSTEQVGVLKHIIAGKRFELSVGSSSLILNADGTIILQGKEISINGSKQVTINGKMVEIN